MIGQNDDFTALSELLEPTPVGVIKLLASWDELPLAMRMHVTKSACGNGLGHYPDAICYPLRLRGRIAYRALSDRNPVVRSVAARRLFEPDKQTLEKIENDDSEIVRFARSEGFLIALPVADDFRSLNQYKRLVLVRSVGLTIGTKQLAARLTEYFKQDLFEDPIFVGEMLDVLHEFLARFPNSSAREKESRNKQLRRDYYGMYTDNKGIEELWTLTTVLPETFVYLICEHAPAPPSYLAEEFAAKVLEKLPSYLSEMVLFREDIPAKAFRRSIWKESDEDSRKRWACALCGDFEFDERDLEALIYDWDLLNNENVEQNADNGDEVARTELLKIERLKAVARSVRDARLAILEAVFDLLHHMPSLGTFSFSGEDAWYADQSIKRRLAELTGENREYQIFQLRVYRLAKEVVPWKGMPDHTCELPEGLGFLQRSIDRSSTWQTYLNFLNHEPALRQDHATLGLLPEFWEDEGDW